MLIAGVDEVGRGPLAGAVVSAAVILKKNSCLFKDSKLLSHNKRLEVAQMIKNEAIAYAYGRAEVYEIENLNIHNATLLSMQRALSNLEIHPALILCDGLFVPDGFKNIKAIVKGDTFVPQISAASILAKVARDLEMQELDLLYPQYGFAKHKGYATSSHRQSIMKYGLSPIHRKSFCKNFSS